MAARDTALKLRIKDITAGELKKGDGEWESCLLTPLSEKAGRVRVLGTVVKRFKSDNGKYAVLTLDDATDTITTRAFNEDVSLIEKAMEGDIVDVIGRVKEYEDERYINLETVSKIDDPNWEMVRGLELALKIKAPGGDKDVKVENQKSKVKDIIEHLDEGSGVKYLYIIEETGMSDEKLEEILSELMEAGEVYEPKIGKFKRVQA
jgi:DNA polymerase III alpha subunit